MTLRLPAVCAAALALWALTISVPAIGRETGRWRMPSSVAQFWGYGNGPGYHAPMIRSPGYRPPTPPRLTYVPAWQRPFCPPSPSVGPCPSCRASYPPAPTPTPPLESQLAPTPAASRDDGQGTYAPPPPPIESSSSELPAPTDLPSSRNRKSPPADAVAPPDDIAPPGDAAPPETAEQPTDDDLLGEDAADLLGNVGRDRPALFDPPR